MAGGFEVLRYTGIAYLLFLAWKNLKTVAWQVTAAGTKIWPLQQFYTKGFIGNLLNPGTLFLYFSFIPQFIHPEQKHILRQNITLCLLQMAGSTLTNFTLVYVAGFATDVLKDERYQQRLRYSMSALIVLFALKMLFS